MFFLVLFICIHLSRLNIKHATARHFPDHS